MKLEKEPLQLKALSEL